MKTTFLCSLLMLTSCLAQIYSDETGPHADQSITETGQWFYEIGWRLDVSKGGKVDVQLQKNPEICIPQINKLQKVTGFFLAYDGKTLKEKEFATLKARPEATKFYTLYGTLSSNAFAKLAEKFPNIEALILWGFVDSDLTQLPPLDKLVEFAIDPDQIVTVPEAKRLAMSRNLEDIKIARAASKEVFDILKNLPKLKSLSVWISDENGHETHYQLPEKVYGDR